jgi:hypothetical protein
MMTTPVINAFCEVAMPESAVLRPVERFLLEALLLFRELLVVRFVLLLVLLRAIAQMFLTSAL